MSPHEDAVDALTSKLYREHLASLNDTIDDLRRALGHPGKRIADLQIRLERAVDANVTLRRENARLRVEYAQLYEQQVYDQQEQMERALRLEAERL